VARFRIFAAPDPDGIGTAWFDDLSIAQAGPPPPDTTPPSVNITFPISGTTVSNNILVSANASDNVAVAGVQFQMDGVDIGAEDTTAPYNVSLDTTTTSDGNHTLTAVARDSAGLTTTSNPVQVVVNNNNRPNIVLIITDDQRWDTMQYMPLINSLLGSEAVKFSEAFVSTPLCCPSRSGTLTGLYTHNHGVFQNYPPNGGATFFNDSSTLATWLEDTGYRTGLYGKYLNDYDALSPYIPPGWSEWHALTDPDDNLYFNYLLNDNGVITAYGSNAQDYSTDVVASKAVQFINNTPQGQPLFLFFTPFAPHAPFIPAPADVGSFSSLPPWRPPSYNEADVSDKPFYVQQRPLLTPSQSSTGDQMVQSQLESLQSVDRAVQSIVNALSSAGRLDNTIIIFTSDHGYMWGEHRLLDEKDCVYEECIRVPFWVRVPGQTARTETQMVQNIDLAPTLAEFAGVVLPSPVNGSSFVSILNDPAAPWRSEILVELMRPTEFLNRNFQAVRTSQYIYAEYNVGDRELYDLAVDPYQLTNVVNDPAYASVVTNLQNLLNILRNQ
jgi:arylsulfatase A-like enzyme